MTSKELFKNALRLEKEEITELRELIELLKIPPEDRNEKIIQMIINCFNEKSLLEIFQKEKGKEIQEKLINDCFARHMQITKLKINEILFRIQDVGDKFYFILNGKIGVLLPEKKKKVMTQLEYFNFLEKYLLDNETALLRMIFCSNYSMISFENFEVFYDYAKAMFKKQCYEFLNNLNNPFGSFNKLFEFYNANKQKFLLYMSLEKFDDINFLTGKNLENIRENIIEENRKAEDTEDNNTCDDFDSVASGENSDQDDIDVKKEQKFFSNKNKQKSFVLKKSLNINSNSSNSLTKSELDKENINNNSEKIVENQEDKEYFNDKAKIKNNKKKKVEVLRIRKTKEELDKIKKAKHEKEQKEIEIILENNQAKIYEISKSSVLKKFELKEEEIKLEKQYSYMNENKEAKEFNIYEYFQVSLLTNKQYFGDLALDSFKKKRTATTIALEECILGWIPKEVYTNYILLQKQEHLLSESAFLHNLEIFKPTTYTFFKHKLFEHFTFEQRYRNEILIDQGNPINKIYILKTGSIDVTINASVVDLINILNLFIEKLKEYEIIDKQEYHKLQSEYLLSFNTRDVDGHQKEKFLVKKNFKIFSSHEGEILGLEGLFLGLLAPYKITVSSENANVFSIDSINFNNILRKFKESRERYRTLSSNKIRALLNRLNHSKMSFINLTSMKDNESFKFKKGIKIEAAPTELNKEKDKNTKKNRFFSSYDLPKYFFDKDESSSYKENINKANDMSEDYKPLIKKETDLLNSNSTYRNYDKKGFKTVNGDKIPIISRENKQLLSKMFKKKKDFYHYQESSNSEDDNNHKEEQKKRVKKKDKKRKIDDNDVGSKASFSLKNKLNLNYSSNIDKLAEDEESYFDKFNSQELANPSNKGMVISQTSFKKKSSVMNDERFAGRIKRRKKNNPENNISGNMYVIEEQNSNNIGQNIIENNKKKDIEMTTNYSKPMKKVIFEKNENSAHKTIDNNDYAPNEKKANKFPIKKKNSNSDYFSFENESEDEKNLSQKNVNIQNKNTEKNYNNNNSYPKTQVTINKENIEANLTKFVHNRNNMNASNSLHNFRNENNINKLIPRINENPQVQFKIGVENKNKKNYDLNNFIEIHHLKNRQYTNDPIINKSYIKNLITEKQARNNNSKDSSAIMSSIENAGCSNNDNQQMQTNEYYSKSILRPLNSTNSAVKNSVLYKGEIQDKKIDTNKNNIINIENNFVNNFNININNIYHSTKMKKFTSNDLREADFQKTKVNFQFINDTIESRQQMLNNPQNGLVYKKVFSGVFPNINDQFSLNSKINMIDVNSHFEVQNKNSNETIKGKEKIVFGNIKTLRTKIQKNKTKRLLNSLSNKFIIN